MRIEHPLKLVSVWALAVLASKSDFAVETFLLAHLMYLFELYINRLLTVNIRLLLFATIVWASANELVLLASSFCSFSFVQDSFFDLCHLRWRLFIIDIFCAVATSGLFGVFNSLCLMSLSILSKSAFVDITVWLAASTACWALSIACWRSTSAVYVC